ncbi:hypothetical protein [Cohnella terricola]|uniref:Glycosyl transferase n=1 Tax=Cohnella terricola TaxID=1289167 RepID=A0A559J6L3_9BACL|nr:hypothetical protein [Cohnella terricola]TVX95501.1 hypothetical protein FPZ45_23540 [Cohnella terricola]
MSSNGNPCRPAAYPSFAHLRRLTDDTGLIEHALGRIPRRREGYTTDDNARALWTATEWLSGFEDRLEDEDRKELNRLADIYLAFMLWAQEENGWFLNNFAYDRSLEPEEISHDCQGRSIWSCADAWIRLTGPHRETARAIFERSLPTMRRIDSLRGQAFAMASCAHVLQASQEGAIDLPLDVKSELQDHLVRLESVLIRAYWDFSGEDWQWFEPAMTYSNGVLPWAMLRTYRFTRREDTLATGLESLSFLLEVMTADEGWLRPIGNEGWYTSESGKVSHWDQQPLEMFKLALAVKEASIAAKLSGREQAGRLVGSARGGAEWSSGGSGRSKESERNSGAGHRAGADRSGFSANSAIVSGERYEAALVLCREWYYGANDLRVPVADPTDGSCCDGLTPYGPNINCGAEATISYLMTEALCRR